MLSFGPSSDSIRTYRGQNKSLSITVEDKVRMKSQYKYMFQKILDLSDGEERFEEVSHLVKLG